MNRIALFLSFLFPFLLAAQPVEMRIHPSQVGLFGAGNGDIMTANAAAGGGQWSTPSSLQAGLNYWTESGGNVYRSTGRVGIGISNPSAALDVYSGNINMNHNALYGPSGWLVQDMGTHIAMFQNSNTSLSRIDIGENTSFKTWWRSTGGIGIGVYPPTERIEIGDGYIYANGEGTGLIVDASGSHRFGFVKVYGYAPQIRYAGSPLEFTRIAGVDVRSGAATTTMTLAANGFVGIGLPPTQALDVSGNVQFSGALMPNGNAGTAGYVLTSTGAGSPPNYSSPATLVSNGGGLTTTTSLSGDITGLYNATQIAADAVTSAEIANSSITGFDIAAATITSTNLNTTGVASGTYGSATQAPVITVGTDGRIISASNATISGTNIYTTDGSLTGNRTVTIGANSLTMKNTTTGTGHKLLILSDYMGGSNNPKLMSFTDESDVERGYISNNTNTGVNIYGQYGIDMQSGGNILFRPNGKTFGFYGTGYISFENIASDPGSTGDGALWYNYVAGRMKYTASSTTHSIASVETDIVGDAPAANSSSFTLPAQQFYTVADANGGSFTITFDATMREGIDYVIECRRNGSNTITFDAGSGYNLAVDTISTFPDDGAVAMGGGGTGIQAAHKVYYVRRHGSSISVK